MEKQFFSTESPSPSLILFRNRTRRHGLLLTILSFLSFILAILNIVIQDNYVIYSVSFSVIDGFFGIVVGGFGLYAANFHRFSLVQKYKIAIIVYSIIYILSKVSSGILDIKADPSNVYLIITFSLIILISLPLCFYFSISAALYANKLKKHEKDPFTQPSNKKFFFSKCESSATTYFIV